MAAFEDIVSVHYHEMPDARFRVLLAGDGPDIVWVPGGDSAAHYWPDRFDHFSAHLRSTAYDPRGAGETTSSPPPCSMKQFGEDCAAIIEAFCRPPVILAGLSMGALITQQVAINHPHLVRLAMPADFAACHYAAFAYPANAIQDEDLWERVKAAYTRALPGGIRRC